MKEQSTSIFLEKIQITNLTRGSAIDLMRHSFFDSARRRGDVLSTGLRYKLLQAQGLIPSAIRLVAFHTEEKAPIGFLYLEKNTGWLYTIEYLFVDSKYRRRGLATKLLNYAFLIAKENGARKVNLNVTAKSTRAIELYEKLGFKKIGCTVLAQRFLPGTRYSRITKRVIVGQGYLTKFALGGKSRLFKLKTDSKRNRNLLFNIYRQCIDHEWIEFFEIDDSNFIYGSRNVWQPPFFRDVLVNDLTNSYALIFNLPFSSKATVELYSTSISIIPCVLTDLLKNLTNRGVSFAQINFFNLGNKSASNWLEKKGMTTFKFVAMGKNLE